MQQYDAEGRITSRCYEYTNGGANRCYTAEYDADGNPTRFTDPEGADVFAYDALNRLTSVTRQTTGNPDVLESYDYNAIGALRENAGVILDDQRPKLSGSGTADAAVLNSLGGLPVTLDGGGRATAFGGFTYRYNARGKLEQATHTVTGGIESEFYGLDSYFRRTARIRQLTPTAGSPTTEVEEYYVYEGPNVAATIEKNNTVVQSWVYDGVDHPLRLKVPGSTTLIYSYEIDLAGNVRRLRRADGSDAGGYRYTAFGQQLPADAGTPDAQVDQPMRWKGRWLTELTGLYDVRSRQWSPALGSFTSIDEYAFHDRRSTLWGWPNQNPIMWSDTTGHFPMDSPHGGAWDQFSSRYMQWANENPDQAMTNAYLAGGAMLGGPIAVFGGDLGLGLAGALEELGPIGKYAATLLGLASTQNELEEGGICPSSNLVTVVHFTGAEGVPAIEASGALRAGSFVALPSEVSGMSASEVETALEIQAGRGEFSGTFQTAASNLETPFNGPLTSGGATQFQIVEPIPVTPGTFVPTK